MTTPMGSVGSHVSDLDLDRRAAGTDTAARRTEVEAHLMACARCAERWREVEAAQAAFRERPLPDFLSASAPGVTSLAEARAGAKRPSRWVGPAIGALALAAVVLLVVRPFGTAPVGGTAGMGGPGGDEGGVRTKGQVGTLLMSVVTPGPGGARGPAHALAPTGETVHPGDILQWRVTLRAARHVAILSRDAASKVSVYFPSRGAMPRLDAGEAQSLGTEVELDATLGAETIWALFCEAPEDLLLIHANIARDGERATFPVGCSVEVAKLMKRAGP